jgi:hypothetical protein
MRIVQLVGNLAGTVVDMDYAEATACIACGTARALTKNEEQAPTGADIAQWNADHAPVAGRPVVPTRKESAAAKAKTAASGKAKNGKARGGK